MKVIISNRDKYIRREIARQLREHYPSCEVESYDDALLAAKTAYRDPADAIVAGSDGIKLVPMLRKQGDELQIIIIADNSSHRDEAYSLGANAYITLPLNEELLFSAVDGTLDMDMDF